MQDSIGQAMSLFMINDAAKSLSIDWNNKKKGLVKSTGEYSKWRITGSYNTNSKADITMGPFPGSLSAITFVAFDYIAIDILCLEKILLQDAKGESLDILEVKMR